MKIIGWAALLLAIAFVIGFIVKFPILSLLIITLAVGIPSTAFVLYMTGFFSDRGPIL